MSLIRKALPAHLWQLASTSPRQSALPDPAPAPAPPFSGGAQVPGPVPLVPSPELFTVESGAESVWNEADAGEFIPYNWSPLPPTWTAKLDGGKLVAYAPDSSSPSGWTLREDVLVTTVTEDSGEQAIKFKLKPWSISEQMPQQSKFNAKHSFDAAKAMLMNPILFPAKEAPVITDHEVPLLRIGDSSFFPGEARGRCLDVAAMVESATLTTKPSSSRRPHLPSVPIMPPPSCVDPALARILWRGPQATSDPPSLPFRVSEPDQKACQLEKQAKSDLAHTLSVVGLVSSLTEGLRSLATNLHTTTDAQLKDILGLMGDVADHTASLAATGLPHLAKSFAEARAEMRKSAARTIPEAARQGVLRSVPLSLELFDKDATERVLAAMPTIIQVPVPQYR